jgi:ABC-2 type transport system permease protein
MYFLWPGVLAAVLQVLLLGLALAFASEFENGSFKK